MLTYRHKSNQCCSVCPVSDPCSQLNTWRQAVVTNHAIRRGDQSIGASIEASACSAKMSSSRGTMCRWNCMSVKARQTAYSAETQVLTYVWCSACQTLKKRRSQVQFPVPPGEAPKAGSGYDLCSCPDDKPQNSFFLH